MMTRLSYIRRSFQIARFSYIDPSSVPLPPLVVHVFLSRFRTCSRRAYTATGFKPIIDVGDDFIHASLFCRRTKWTLNRPPPHWTARELGSGRSVYHTLILEPHYRFIPPPSYPSLPFVLRRPFFTLSPSLGLAFVSVIFGWWLLALALLIPYI